jgi:hypothetical protein
MNAFDLLPMSEKIRMIKLGGDFIKTINHKNHCVSLYRVDNFLVERCIDNETKKTISMSSVDTMGMLKYMPHITISSIYRMFA